MSMCRSLSRLAPSVLRLAIFALALFGFARVAGAAPEAHILRIDPRAGVAGGAPLLTTVVEVVEMKRISDVLRPCAAFSKYEQALDCWSEQLEKPGALWNRFPFPDANARLFVKVQGEDRLAKFVSKQEWGQAQKEPNVGTAWLVSLDASSGMGARYGEAREVARQFIEAMRPGDLMDLMIFGDQQVVHDSKWKAYKDRNDLVGVLNAQPGTLPSRGPDKPLFNLIKQMTKDAFGDLGSTTGPQNIPLHQAMVFLSNGAGRGDAASASPTAEVFSQYLNKGRFPEDNTSLPKTPLPVISIWFPSRGSLVNDVYRNNDAQFMQSLANPQIGGYFNVIREGAAAKGKNIIQLVQQRFNAMYIVKWRLACMNPSVEQTFNLVFENTKPTIAPDGTFKEVPIGVDPTQWPLDVDVERTKAEAQSNPLHPGGTFRVYGDFCWGGDKGRAEAYFVPAGTQAPPQQNARDPELAKKAMQQLIAQNMRGGAVEAGDAFATFNVPDDEKVLEGTGDTAVARVVLYDNKAKRASAVDATTVLSLKAGKKPLNLVLLAGIGGGVVVLLLLAVVLMRGGGGGGGKGGKRGRPAPQPVMAGPGYGGAPPPGGGYGGPPPHQGGGGYGGPHQGGGGGYGGPPPHQGGGGGYGGPPQGGGHGGYGATPVQAAPTPAPVPLAPAAAPPAMAHAPAMAGMPGTSALPLASGAGGPAVQIRCPACGMTTMATPGQGAVCFSCGQPMSAEATAQLAAAARGQAAAEGAEGGGGVAAPSSFPVDRGPQRAARGATEPLCGPFVAGALARGPHVHHAPGAGRQL